MIRVKKVVSVFLIFTFIFHYTSIFAKQSTGIVEWEQNSSVVDDVYGFFPDLTNYYDDYIVAFKDTYSMNNEMNRFNRSASNFSRAEERIGQKVLKVKLSKRELQEYRSRPDVAFIEPDYPVTVLNDVYGIPNKDNESYYYFDPESETLSWGLYAVGADKVIENGVTGTGVKVAVLDTGISHHPDLSVAGGVSFVEGSPSYVDDHGHGTYVAGIIGANYNGEGIAGVAPDVNIYAVKVLDANGNGSYSQVISGIEWALANGMDIVNISFGGYEYSQILHEVIKDATRNGLTVVAAAGNNGAGTLTYPSMYPEVVAVGAVDKTHTRAAFSNTNGNLDIVAPGVGIISTTIDGDYGTASGTSAASPFVTGALALLKSVNPELDNTSLRNLMFDSATSLGDPFEYGHGLLNIAKSFNLTETSIPPLFISSPDHPDTVVFANSGDMGDVSIMATERQGDNQTIRPGQAVTVSVRIDEAKTRVYVGVFNPAGDKLHDAGDTFFDSPANAVLTYTWQTKSSTPSGVYKIKYDYAGTSYVDWFTVYVVQDSPPQKPSGLMTTGATQNSISIAWNEVAGASEYVVRLNGTTTYVTRNSSFQLTNLLPDTSYTFEVAARNAYGTSGYTLLAPNPRTLPEPPLVAPTNLRASATHNSITFSWDHTPFSSYAVRINGGNQQTVSSNSFTFHDLQANTVYSLEVASRNSRGELSTFRSTSKRTLFPVPSGLYVTNDSPTSMTLHWNSIQNASFSVYLDDVYQGTTTNNSYPLTGLQAGKRYKLQVASKNSAGELSAFATYNNIPTPTGLAVTTVTASSIGITWNGMAGMTHSLNKNNTYETTIAANSYVFSGLQSNTQYTFQVAYKDSQSQLGPYAEIKKRTLFPPPINLKATSITENAITVTWDAIPGAEYNIYLDGNYKGTTITNSYTIENLQSGTEHEIKVASKNNDGALSAFTSTKIVTLADTEAPNVTIRITSGEPYVVDNDIRLSITATDNNAVANKVLTIFRNGNTIQTVNLTSDTYVYTPTLVGHYTFAVEATDPSNNKGTAQATVEVDKVRHVVVFVPGFMGSEIIRDNKIIWLDSIYVGSSLSLGGDGNPIDNSTFGGPLLEYGEHDFGKGFVDHLHSEDIEIVYATYDWRRDLRLAADEISKKVTEAYLTNARKQKITIITHSTGGLAARFYLANDASAKTMVKSFINIASPNLGSVRAMSGLTEGDKLGVGAWILPFSQGQAREMVQNMPAVYQLMPGRKFVNAYSTAYPGVDFQSFFQRRGYSLDGTPDTVGDVTTFEETKEYIRTFHNRTLYEDPDSTTSFRNQIEKAIDPAIKEYRMIGYGVETIVQLYKKNTGSRADYFPIYGLGDEVVPLLSAEMSNVGNSINYYFPSQHISIMNNGQFRQTVTEIIRTGSGPWNNRRQRPALTELKGHNINIHCPVNVTIIDQNGNTAYVDENGVLVNNIADISYDILGQSKLIFIPDGKSVEFIIEGYDNGLMDVGIVEYFEMPTKVNILPNLKVSEHTVLNFTFTGGQSDPAITNFYYDYKGDGESEVLHATTEISLEEYFDPTAPVTEHVIEGESIDAWYSSDVTLTLSATDEGVSQVEHTFITINGTEQEYTAPITLTSDGKYTISYYSVDRVGNLEIPKEIQFYIDRTPPSAPDIIVPDNWTNNDVTVNILPGEDNLSEVIKVQYILGELDEATTLEWVDFIDKFLIKEEGNTLITARSIDQSGNVSETSTAIAKIDLTNPRPASISLSKYGWTNQDVMITITSGTDDLSGTAGSQYRLRDSDPWVHYERPVTVTHEGETTVTAITYDVAGNRSSETTAIIKIDKTAPTPPTTIFTSHLKYDELTLEWEGATDDVGIAEYKVYTKHGILISTTSKTSVLIDDLLANTVYGFYVETVDLAGNISEPSQFFTVETPTKPKFLRSRTAVYLDSDGAVWTWGDNWKGQLGDGTYERRDTPRKVPGLTEVKDIVTWVDYTIAIKKDGTVWAWGGPPFNSNIPVQVNGLTDIKAVHTRDGQMFAVGKDGKVWVWGEQLKVFYNMDLEEPVEEGYLRGNFSLSIGFNHGLAVGAKTWAWGDNTFGQLGDLTNTNSFSPVQVAGDYAFQKVIAGNNFSYALTQDGMVMAWGSDNFGELGNSINYNFSHNWPDYVRKAAWGGYPPITDIKDIAAANKTGFALTHDGKVWAWGNNIRGSTGLNSSDDTIHHAELVNISNVKEIIATLDAEVVYALKEDGTLWAWGDNEYHKLGLGENWASIVRSPTRVPNMNSVDIVNLIGDSITVIKEDGTLWGWSTGIPSPQQFIIDDVAPQAPTNLSTREITLTSVDLTWIAPDDPDADHIVYEIFVDNVLYGETDLTSISIGELTPGLTYQFAVSARDLSGNISELSDLLTITLPEDVEAPTPPGNIIIRAVTFNSVHLSWDSSIDNVPGEIVYEIYNVSNETLLHSTSDNQSTIANLLPESEYSFVIYAKDRAGNISSASEIFYFTTKPKVGGNYINSSGHHTLYVKEDGSVWGWGNNQYGQLGNGTTTTATTSTRMEELSEVVSVAAGDYHSLALKADGTVWAVGYNASGQLGIGNYLHRHITPVQVTGLTDVIAVAASGNTSYALKMDGTVWNWGVRPGDGRSQNIPEQVLNMEGVVAITAGGNFALALKSDGTVWGWGRNSDYQLGSGTTTTHTIPVQANITGVKALAAGDRFSLALKEDGTMWSWGYNAEGQLGNGTTTRQIQPTKIGEQDHVASIHAGSNYSMAIKEDGTVWSWGNNRYGQLGDGTTVNRFSPVEVLVQGEIEGIATGRQHVSVLKANGSVWSWGDNASGQLGDGTTTPSTQPVQLVE